MSKHLWIRRADGTPIIGFRFGLHHGLFSERHQGTRGIPRRFFYLLGGRLTIIKPSQRLNSPTLDPGERHTP